MMGFDPFTALFDLGKTTIEKIWPDANKRAEEIRKLEELRQHGDLEKMTAEISLLLAQIDVNKTAATSKSLFVAGARPAAIWVCVISLAMVYWPKAAVMTVMWCMQAYVTIQAGSAQLPIYPDVGLMEVIGLLAPLLGVSTLRTFDKSKGVQTDALG